MTMTETLGQRIAQRRKMLSLSQEAFGEKMGVSRQAISKWEADAAIPEVDRLIEMSKLFGVSVGWLLGTECQTNTPAAEAPIPIVLTPPDIAVPTPEIEPVPDPPQDSEPPKSPLVWLSPICAVLAVASLILSILTFSRSRQKDISPTTETALSYEELLSKNQELEDALDYCERRIEDVHERSLEYRAQTGNNSELIEGLTKYVYALPQASGILPGPTKYDVFSSWNIVGTMDRSMNSVNVIFSCNPAIDTNIHGIEFIVLQGDKQISRNFCGWAGLSYSCELQLPPENGYRYEVDIHHNDGSEERFELTGHKMSDLENGVMPEIDATRASDRTTASGTLDVAYSEITLSEPRLMPQYCWWKWKTFRLVHYHNGVASGEHDLTELVKHLYHDGETVTFSLSNKSFSAATSKQGDIHEIRLEGDLTVYFGEYSTYPYSILLETWENTEEGLTLVE